MRWIALLLSVVLCLVSCAMPVFATTHQPMTTAALRTDLDTDAVCGDTIELANGTDYDVSTTSLKLRNKGCSAANPITLKAATVPAVPDCNDLWVHDDILSCWTTWEASWTPPTLTVSNTGSSNFVMKACFDADGYKFIGIKFRTTYAATALSNDQSLIVIGQGCTEDATDAALYPTADPANLIPTDYEFDRVICAGTTTGNNGRCLIGDVNQLTFKNSWCKEFHATAVGSSDTNCGQMSGHHHTWTNNALNAAGEVLIYPGYSWTEALMANNITVTENYVYKPFSWFSGHGSYGGIAWKTKNLFELKCATDVTIDKNIFHGHWVDAQPGPAIVLTVVNQYGVAANTSLGQVNASWCTIRRVTFTNNVVRHVSDVFVVTSKNNAGDPTNYPTVVARDLTIRNVLCYDVNGVTWGGAAQTNGEFITKFSGDDVLPAEDMTGVSISHVTCDNEINGRGMIHFYTDNGSGSPPSTPDTYTGFTFKDSLMRHGQYGIFGDQTACCAATITAFAPSAVWTKIFIADLSDGGVVLASYPASTYELTEAQFNNCFDNRTTGDYDLASGCSDGTNNLNNFASDGTDIGVNMNALLGRSESAAIPPIRLRLP